MERRLRAVIESHGIDAVTVYIGNPTAHNFSLSRYVAAFAPMSGIQRLYSAGTVDQWPKNVSSALLFGGMWTFPIPDLDRTDYLIVMGANPHASQGSLLAAPDLLARLDAIRARGGKVVVIDPRRTGTAKHADEWLAIRPGTDAALLLAVAQVLFAEDRVRPGRLAEFTNGIDEVEELCRVFTPEAVAETCGVPADAIRRIARELSDAPRAAVYGRIGTCNQEFGTLASWLVDVINVLTGNLDREGGAMFSNPIAWSLSNLTPPDFANGFEFGRWRSRVRGAPEVLGQVPISCLAEEIATPGPGQIKALLTIAGNPVLSAPDAAKLDAALPGLECMISLDNWLNETTRHADVILPGSSVLEQPHYDEMIWSWAVRNAGKYSEAVFETEPERPAEWQILLEARRDPPGPEGRRRGRRGDRPAVLRGHRRDDRGGSRAPRSPAATRARSSRRPARRGRSACSTSRSARGRGATAMARIRTDSRSRSSPRSRTASTWGRSSRACPVCSRRSRARSSSRRPTSPATWRGCTSAYHGATRVSCSSRRRHVRSNNSWMHNVSSLVTGKDRCTLLVHPDDARAAGLVEREARADHLARGQHRRARGGVRRDAPGRGLPAARLGPRQARHADRGGVPARRGLQQRDRAGRAGRRAVGQRDRERDPGRGVARVA